jgi:hypothetical protein
MTIGNFETDTSATAPITELGIVSTPRRAAVDEVRLLNPMKDGVEFRVGDVERVASARILQTFQSGKTSALADSGRD